MAMACSNCARCNERIDRLRFGREDLRFGGGDVAFGHRKAGVELIAHDLERLFVFLRIADQQVVQGIRRKQIEISGGERRLRRKLGVVEIGGGRLRRRRVALDLPAHLAPDVEIPGAGEARNERCRIRADAAGRGDRAGAAASRSAIGTRCRIARRQVREERGLRFADQRARLLVRGGCRGHVLVGDLNLSQKKRELAIAIDRPPFAAVEIVDGSGDLPALELLERRRDRRRLGYVVGANRAAGKRCQKRESSQARQRAPERSASCPTFPTTLTLGQRNHCRNPLLCTLKSRTTPHQAPLRRIRNVVSATAFFSQRPRPPSDRVNHKHARGFYGFQQRAAHAASLRTFCVHIFPRCRASGGVQGSAWAAAQRPCGDQKRAAMSWPRDASALG